MNAARLLDEVRRLGVEMWPRGDGLHVEAPRRVLTDELIEELRGHKPELLTLLRTERRPRKILAFPPTAEDLMFPLAYFRDQLPSLPPKYRERFDYWRELFESEGWSREMAERAAFQRTLRSKPSPDTAVKCSKEWPEG